LSGRIVKAGSGEALSKATVTLQRSAGPAGPRGGGIAAVTTDADGSFTFGDIQPGQYRIIAERDGYIRQEFGQRSYTGVGTAITAGAGQNLTNINFQLVPAGTIAGRILDEDGEPLAGVQVQALTYVYDNGSRVLAPGGRQVQTNDLGEYRLYWLTPGAYVVSATVMRGRGRRPGTRVVNTEETYAPGYFPGVIEPENATAIQVPPAAELRGIDFVLRPVSTLTVRGRVVSPVSPVAAPPRGQPQGPAGPRGQIRQGAQNVRTSIQVVLLRAGSRERNGRPVNPDGSFEISNVVPGTYTLLALQRQEERQFSARTRIEVTDRDIDNVNLALSPGVDVPGQIYIDGTPPAQFQMDRLRIGLISAEDIPVGNSNTQVKADGTFLLSNVSPITYRVNIAGLPADAYAIAGRYGSADALNDPLQIDGGQVLPLQLQIGFSGGRIDGQVTDNRDQPFPGASCVLIPVAPRQNRLDLYKTAATDQFGRFTFAGIAPGDYKVYAWEDIPRGAHLDPLYISRFEDRGRPVRVEKSAAVTLQIPVIPANLR
jgi:protocatechuate 3,4-dioxygenase beta subunit